MNDWYGTARSNWVKVADLPGLGKSLDRFDGVRIVAQDGLCTIHFDNGDAGPFRDPDEHEDLTDLAPLDVADDIMTYLEPGQVLVLIEAGAAGTNCVTGIATAWCEVDGSVSHIKIDLHDIYKQAAHHFQCPVTKAEPLRSTS